MPSNPFARKRTPLDEARRRLDTARGDATEVARSIRDAADDVVSTLESSTATSRIPVIAGAAAATLGVGLYVAKRIRGSSEPTATNLPPPPNVATTRPTAASTPSAAATPALAD